MYQELQIFEDNFDGPVVWGTEGNDLPLPTFSKGDVLDLPGLGWWERAREYGYAYRVVDAKHVLTPTGPGPECNHELQVVVEKFRPEESEVDVRFTDLEFALASETKKVALLRHIIIKTGGLAAREILTTLTDQIVSDMKTSSAQGIEEADNAWEEVAIVLHADGHLLAQMMRDQLLDSTRAALMRLTPAERTALWIWCGGFKSFLMDWDGTGWDTFDECFDPADWRGNLDAVEQRAVNWLYAEMPAIEY